MKTSYLLSQTSNLFSLPTLFGSNASHKVITGYGVADHDAICLSGKYLQFDCIFMFCATNGGATLFSLCNRGCHRD